MTAGFLLPSSPMSTLDEWLATETGGLGIQRAQELGPDATIDEIRRSGLRGRGGGGFPTGRKWATVASASEPTRYVVCNAAEGEPATFKDRAIMRSNPYQIVEGLMIAALAVRATGAYLCVKASHEPDVEAVTRAVREMQAAGICRDCEITIVAGPDDYLYGEEKAMLEVIEGGGALPRLLPPYEHGLFATTPQAGWEGRARTGQAGASHPTVVNNAETLANVPHILAHGADWFRGFGTDDSPGTVVCTVTGDVVAPDVGEVEMGTPLRAAIVAIGSGLPEGRRIKAVASGVSNAVLSDELLDTPMTHRDMAEAGTGLGAAGYVVYDDTACMVQVALQFSAFLAQESCGQCPPCKLGSTEITERLLAIESGLGTEDDIGIIRARLRTVTDASRCYLATEEQIVVSSILDRFPEEFVEHLEHGACPRPRELELPRLLELTGGRATNDPTPLRLLPHTR